MTSHAVVIAGAGPTGLMLAAELALARIAERFLSEGKTFQVAGFALIPLDIGDFPTRHNYGLALTQNHIERLLAAWASELSVPIYRGREVTDFAQDETGVDVGLSAGGSLRAEYLVGCDGGRSVIRKKAGIAFPGWDPSVSYLIAEATMAGEPHGALATGLPAAMWDHLERLAAEASTTVNALIRAKLT